MTTRLSRTPAVLGCAVCLLVSFQACSSEPHTAKNPVAKIDAAAPPGSQPSGSPPEVQCPPCTAIACPEPVTSTERTPVPCGTDMDCDSRFCDRGVCGALRTGNLPNGIECRADDHCQSGLCDRGVCTDIGGQKNLGHGEACEQGPPFAKRPRNSRPQDQCGAYVCIDGRCRSCESDSECIHWKGAGRCEHVPGLPGKSCGNHGQVDADRPHRTPPPLSPSRLPSGAVPTLPPAGS